MNTPLYDIVIFGATSFVGQLLVEYYAQLGNQSDDFRWAIAGRSETKLAAVGAKASALGKETSLAYSPPVILADAEDEASLQRLCQQTRVVVSTVGPYSLYGEQLVKVCAESGTDYCDLTGEIHWVLQMMSRYQPAAQNSGARIVHCCGFDSIPSDLGVLYTQNIAKARFGRACNKIATRVSSLKGSFSGGTYASLLSSIKQLSANAPLRKAVASPYCLCPSDHPYDARQHKIDETEWDKISEQWVAPFIMAGVNTRIVHRSNALCDSAYGEDFLYSEALLTGTGAKGRKLASKISFGLKALMLGAALPPTRWLMQQFFLPKPGEGPSPEAQKKGKFTLQFIGLTTKKDRILCEVSGDRDPGYGSSAKMLGQAALCLAMDVPKMEKADTTSNASTKLGGFWTPASLLGTALIERLSNYSGISFSVATDKENLEDTED